MKSPSEIHDSVMSAGFDIYVSTHLILRFQSDYNLLMKSVAKSAVAYRDASIPSDLAKLSRYLK